MISLCWFIFLCCEINPGDCCSEEPLCIIGSPSDWVTNPRGAELALMVPCIFPPTALGYNEEQIHKLDK